MEVLPNLPKKKLAIYLGYHEDQVQLTMLSKDHVAVSHKEFSMLLWSQSSALGLGEPKEKRRLKMPVF